MTAAKCLDDVPATVPADALTLADRVREDYQAYFRSEFPIKDPRLAEAVWRHINGRDSPIVRGPYLQVSRLDPGAESRDSFGIDPDLLARLPDYFQAPFPHQAEAWRKLRSGSEQHLILTSGTGSGKTEALLVPILDDLLRHPAQGLQALLVYPMNALLQDQHRRLTDPKEGLLPPRRDLRAEVYTGATRPEDKERILRDPPQILLTNYKMLELMVLRGELARLVASSGSARLRWMFYDELHTFTGVRGAEVAYLNRRVREAAGVGKDELRFVAASATAGDDEAAKEKLVAFASRFFDAPFRTSGVVGFPSGVEPDSPSALGKPAIPEHPDARERQVLEQALLYAFHRPCTLEEGAARWLPSDPVRAALGSGERIAEIRAALAALWRYPRDSEARPAIDHRVHLFVAGNLKVEAELEATVFDFSRQPPAPDARPRFVLALCRECGQHGFLARLCVDKTAGIDGQVVRPVTGRVRDLPPDSAWLVADSGEAKELQLVHVWWSDTTHRWTLAGADDAAPADGAQLFRAFAPGRKWKQGTSTWKGFTTCPFCDARHPRGEQIRPILSGASSNLTTLGASVLRAAPLDERKVIVFADSRQDVALQAGFTNDRWQRVAVAALLGRFAGRTETGSVPFDFAFRSFFNQVAAAIPRSSIPEDEVDARRRAAWLALATSGVRTDFTALWLDPTFAPTDGSEAMDELERCVRLTVKEAISDSAGEPTGPEVAGLLSVDYRGRNGRKLRDFGPQLAAALDLGVERVDEAVWLTRWTLDHVRRRHWDKNLVPARAESGDEDKRRDYGLMVAGKSGATTFQRLLKRLSPSFEGATREAKIATVERFLAVLKDCGFLVETRRKLHLAKAAIQLSARGTYYRCDHCCARRFLPDGAFPATLPCLESLCQGSMEARPLAERDQSYYYRLAQLALDATVVHAAEHSGWIDDDRRVGIEASYNRSRHGTGDVTAIVASPTLEMGVDLKRTPVVLLRNVPPTAASYRQRIGRAGRDSKAALSIAHTRASPYDQLFFEDPRKLIKGQVHSLVMPLDNAVVLSRHVHAYLLETAPDRLVDKLRFWRPLLFTGPGAPETIPDTSQDPDVGIVERELVEPMVAHGQRRLEKIVAIFDNATRETLAAIVNDVGASLRQPVEAWVRRYRELRAEFLRHHQQGVVNLGPGADAADRDAKRARLLLLTHFGYSRHRQYQSATPWAPLMYLADRGYFPRYEFPGDTLGMTCFTRKNEPQELVDDRFKALRDWSPGSKKEKAVWALGGKFRPKFYRVEMVPGADTLFRYCDDHNFVSREADSACPICSNAKQAIRLEPTRVDAEKDGAIGDDAEDRSLAGLSIKLFVTAKQGPFEHALSDEAAVNTASASFLLYRKSRVTMTQLVAPTAKDGGTGSYEWCPHCSALRVPPAAAQGDGDAEPVAEWHARSCKLQGALNQGDVKHKVVVYAERGPVDAIELRLPPMPEVDARYLEAGIDARRSVTEALLRAGRELMELGPRGEGFAADVFDDGESFLVFFDPVPGGSGVIPELWSRRDAWFELAYDQMRNVEDGKTGGCRCAVACERCLLDYGNQRFHSRLSRHAARDVLLTLRKTPGKFWSIDQLASSTARRNTDPVSFDPSSPLERRFAELASFTFGVTAARLRSQVPGFEGERLVTPDYRSEVNGRFLFVDGFAGSVAGTLAHGDWTTFRDDCAKRNAMTAHGKEWTVLTSDMIRNLRPHLVGALQWLGAVENPPEGWPTRLEDLDFDFPSPGPLAEAGRVRLQRLAARCIAQAAHGADVTWLATAADFAVGRVLVRGARPGPWDCFRATSPDGKVVVGRFVEEGSWSFREHLNLCTLLTLAGCAVYQIAVVPLDQGELEDARSLTVANV